MNESNSETLLKKIKEEIAKAKGGLRIAIAGSTTMALETQAALATFQEAHHFLGIYSKDQAGGTGVSSIFKHIEMLVADAPDIVVIAEDAKKEALLEELASVLPPAVKILITGYAHFEFSDPVFDRIVRDAYIPSFANGYPNSLVHIFQCLRAAAERDLHGVVAEFGMFKGGTTMLISKFIEAFQKKWKVFGFDTFDGFPARRNVLDMYSHPDCVFLDISLVQRCFSGRNVEIVPGDVVQTAHRLAEEDIVCAFVDTDNFTSASAILDVITDRIVVGGSIVFDHFTGTNRHLYTIGERIAAKRLTRDPRFFNLHGTGVFLRT